MKKSIELNSLVSNVNSRAKGTIFSINSERPAKIKAGFKKAGDVLEKHSRIIIRQGHSYYNQSEVIRKHQSGEREKYSPEKLWHKQSDLGSAFREHKGNGTIYLVGQPVKGSKSNTVWILNGSQVSYEQIEPMLLASEKRKDEELDHLTIKVENIVSINNA